MSDLFLEHTIEFEKTGGEVALPEDPNLWPNEIHQELYKQVPYIADFHPNIVMDRVDGERGYALGRVEIQNKTELQPGTPQESLDAAGVKQARIPIIVKDRKLQPFDVLVTAESKMLPLTEERLRSVVFRPQAFDVTSKSPGDMSMIGQLYPPYRQNYGFGGGGTLTSAGMGKSGSARGRGEKTASILKRILSTINESDFHKFAGAAVEHRGAFAANRSSTQPSLSILASYEGGSLQKAASAMRHVIKPTVVQIVKLDDGYQVKTGSYKFWAPNSYVVDHGRLVKDFGVKLALAADMDGAVTAVEGGAEEAPVEAPVEAIAECGVYEVQDDKGQKLVGLVIPNLIDLDGTALPIAMFTNNAQVAVQSEIAGTLVGDCSAAPIHWGDHPRGKGCFARPTEEGGFEATIPLDVKVTFNEEGGDVVFMAETYDGRPFHILVQPNIQVITPAPGGHVLIPEDFRWVSLESSDPVVLDGTPEKVGMRKRAQQALVGSVLIRSGGAEVFSVSGELVDKLAYDAREMLSTDDVMFLLGGLGVEPQYMVKKLAEAYQGQRAVEVRCSRMLTLPEEAKGQAKVAALNTLGQLPVLRCELWKEAAMIPDPTAVDTVLSLGFINPENLATFIDSLPILDDTQSRLCDLLFAVRLGMRDISQGCLEKTVKSLEEVIRGLKVIAFQKN